MRCLITKLYLYLCLLVPIGYESMLFVGIEKSWIFIIRCVIKCQFLSFYDQSISLLMDSRGTVVKTKACFFVINAANTRKPMCAFRPIIFIFCWLMVVGCSQVSLCGACNERLENVNPFNLWTTLCYLLILERLTPFNLWTTLCYHIILEKLPPFNLWTTLCIFLF